MSQDSDRVFAAIAIPPGGVFHAADITLKIHGAETPIAQTKLLGIDGYIVPVHDIDAGDLYDTVWDLQVPKSAEGVDTLDLDVETTDSDPDFEMGEIDWNAVFGFEHGNQRIHKSRYTFTAADYPAGLGTTGSFTHYLPTKKIRIKVRSGGRAEVPSLVMFALSSPVLDRTTATNLTMPTDQEWLQLQLLRDTATDALKQLIGLIETGAETPYVEAAAFLSKTLAPDPFEETAAEFASTTWQVLAQARFVMSVPGELSVGRLEGE